MVHLFSEGLRLRFDPRYVQRGRARLFRLRLRLQAPGHAQRVRGGAILETAAACAHHHQVLRKGRVVLPHLRQSEERREAAGNRKACNNRAENCSPASARAKARRCVSSGPQQLSRVSMKVCSCQKQ